MSAPVLMPSALISGTTSASVMDRYLTLNLLKELTNGQSPLRDVFVQATMSFQRLVDGYLAGSDPIFIRLLENHSADLSILLTADRALKSVEFYQSCREILTSQRTPAQPASIPQIDKGEASITHFLNALGPASLEAPLPEIVFFEDRRPVLSEERPGPASRRRFSEGCLELFGREVTLEDFFAGFAVDLPGYRLKRLDLEFFPHGHLDIRGLVVDDDDNTVGNFCRVIPVKPPENQFWIAGSQGIAFSTLDGARRKGLGRHLTQRYLALLKRLGVDGLDFSVSNDGAYVFPKLGFDFANPAIRDRVKILFREYLKQNFPDRSPYDETQWAKIRHAWDISSFRLANTGFPAGEAFLMELGAQGDFASFRVRFLTDASYRGWGLLFGDRIPPEWSDLEESTRASLKELLRTLPDAHDMLISFQTHLNFIHFCVNNWIPFASYPTGWAAVSELYNAGNGELEGKLERLIHILTWMSREHDRGSDLGLAFWNTLHPVTKRTLPAVISGAADLLNVEIQVPKSVVL